MRKDSKNNRKRDLGIFYTPQEVVNFIFEVLNIWKNKEDEEDNRWQTRRPNPHYPSVIDPACGEGIFLKTAVTSSFTGYHPTEKTPYVFGVDLDGEVVEKWEEISILHDLFNGKREKMLNHFHQQDGLLEFPKKVFKYKTGGLREFDTAVGNPPYGGIGFSSLKGKSTPELVNILKHLRKFDIISYRKRKKKKNKNQSSLWEESIWETPIEGGGNHLPTNKEVESIPIEILFIDRFIQLVKSGGWIAIIIPDGILTNSNSHYVREFISHKTMVEAIVSLPRNTFKMVGTNAKTSILFLRKLRLNEKSKQNYPIFLASIKNSNNLDFSDIINLYKNFFDKEKSMEKSQLKMVSKNQSGEELVMVRVDKTLKDLMDEKPSSRWNPNYWHPKFDNLFTGIKTQPLDEYIVDIQGGGGGSHFSAFLGDKWDEENKYARYLHISSLLDTGINWVDAKFVNKKTYQRLKSKQLKEDDILLSNKGSVGKSVVVYRSFNRTIVGDTRVIRVKNISPYFLCVYFKSWYGSMLSEKFKSGVASEGTTVEQLREFPIPIITSEIQMEIESEYKKMSLYHDKAMDEKNKNNNKEYKKNIDVAKSILKELVIYTEDVINKSKDNVI